MSSKRGRRTLGKVLAAFAVLATALVLGLATNSVAHAESENRTFEATTAEGVKVTVSAPVDALPEDAKLSASLINGEDENNNVAAELDEAKVSYDGFVALDVSFTNAAGEKIEPAEAVDVRFELPDGLVPEGAENLAVHHLAENEDGTVADVEAVADAAEKTDGAVTLSEDNTLDAEFQVESFSTFTITWMYGHSVTVHYVDSSGYEIEGNQTSTERMDAGDWVSLSSYANATLEVDGETYVYQGACLDRHNGTEATWVRYVSTNFWKGWEYSNSKNEPTDSGTRWDTSDYNRDIYLVYNEVETPDPTPTSGLYIDDQIIENGTIVPTFADPESDAAKSAVSYKWYKCSEENGQYSETTRHKVTLDSYNMTENGDALYPSLDEGARQWYYVKAFDANGNEVATSDSFQVPLYDALQNGSFETPALSGYGQRNPNYESGEQGMVWQTTADDNEIELIRVDKQFHGGQRNSETWDVYGLTDTANGDQVAELNANSAGALYQDVLTVPGSTLTWQLSHRARNRGNSQSYDGNDTMYVIIMSTSQAASYTEQKQIESLVAQHTIELDRNSSYRDNATGIEIWKLTDGDSWKQHSDQYVVPTGQHATRFFFASGETSFDKNFPKQTKLRNTVGNFIDDVWFDDKVPAPNPDQINLTLSKTVSGLTDEELEDYQVKITVKGNDGREVASVTFNKNNLLAGTEGVYLGSVTRQITLAAGSSSQHYTIEETVTYDGNKEESSTVAVDNGSATQSKEAELTADPESSHTVTFTNSYEETAKLGLNVKKTDASNNPLRNAKFALYVDNGDNMYTAGSETLANYLTNDEEGKTALTADGFRISDETSIATFYGLEPATTYWIVETYAPAGYEISGPYRLVVNDEGDKATLCKSNGEIVGDEWGVTFDQDTNMFTVGFQDNQADMTIPSTGGNGNAPLYVLGAAAVAGSVVMARKRFSNKWFFSAEMPKE